MGMLTLLCEEKLACIHHFMKRTSHKHTSLIELLVQYKLSKPIFKKTSQKSSARLIELFFWIVLLRVRHPVYYYFQENGVSSSSWIVMVARRSSHAPYGIGTFWVWASNRPPFPCSLYTRLIFNFNLVADFINKFNFQHDGYLVLGVLTSPEDQKFISWSIDIRSCRVAWLCLPCTWR